MIDLGRETDGNNEICLGARFALCVEFGDSPAPRRHVNGLGGMVVFLFTFSVPVSSDKGTCVWPDTKCDGTNLAEEGNAQNINSTFLFPVRLKHL